MTAARYLSTFGVAIVSVVIGGLLIQEAIDLWTETGTIGWSLAGVGSVLGIYGVFVAYGTAVRRPM